MLACMMDTVANSVESEKNCRRYGSNKKRKGCNLGIVDFLRSS